VSCVMIAEMAHTDYACLQSIHNKIPNPGKRFLEMKLGEARSPYLQMPRLDSSTNAMR
jgi:hypothetical protein